MNYGDMESTKAITQMTEDLEVLQNAKALLATLDQVDAFERIEAEMIKQINEAKDASGAWRSYSRTR